MQHSPPEQQRRSARAVFGFTLLLGAIASAQAEPDAGVKPRAPLRLIETADGVSVLSNKVNDFPPATDAAERSARAPRDASVTSPAAPEPSPSAGASPPVPNPAARAPLPEAVPEAEPPRWGVYLVALVVALGVILAAYFARARGS
jgi:hypothetical protein